MSNLDTKGNQSVGKALKIIEILAQNGEPMRLMDIAAMVDMPSSTALRMIATLIDFGYIAQDLDTQKYFLTLKFTQIGSLVASKFNLRDIVHPHLLKLTKAYGEASCMAVENLMMVLYVDVVDGADGMLKIMQHIGKQCPLHCTGVGKCLLLNYKEEDIDRLIEEKGLPSYTPNTITTKEGLIQELVEVKRMGYAMDNEECELGARCIACGITDHTGKAVAAISISGPVNRMTPSYVDDISAALKEAAAEISRLL